MFKNLKFKIGSMLSFVGAGGKTTLVFSLSRKLSNMGYSVLVTTTTSMFHPSVHVGFTYDKIFFGNLVTCKKINYSTRGIVFVAADSYDVKNNKLKGYKTEYINQLYKLAYFDFILVEADGAKMKSIKAPDFHEPVVPEASNIVVGCIGLDSIGKSINEFNVHRSKKFLSLLNNMAISSIVDENNILSLIISNMGLFKSISKKMDKIVFLNKADNIELVEKGKNIASLVKNNCPNIVCTIVACLKDKKDPIKLIL